MNNYLLLSTISSIAFYAIYYFFLRKESFHQFNRFYLLSTLLISLLIPFVRFSVPVETNSVSNISGFITYIQLPEITVYAQTPSMWNLYNIVWGIYVLGVIVFALLFIIKLVKISSLIIQSAKNREEKYVYVAYHENAAPFSFFNYIFINSDAYNQEDKERIVLHEQIHVRQRHSWDLIFTELVGIILWFNPILLFYKRSIQITHEYLADHRVLQQGIEQGAYLNLLLRQLVFPDTSVETRRATSLLGHHFNYLLTKNRFKMLKKQNYSKWAFAKVIFVLPFIALLLMLNCKNKPAETVISEETTDCTKVVTLEDGTKVLVLPDGTRHTILDEEIPNDAVVTLLDENGNPNMEYTWYSESKEKDEEIHKIVEQMPEFPGGMQALNGFIKKRLQYPAKAIDEKIQGTTVVQFAVMKDGSVDKVTVYVSANPILDKEAVRVIKMLPKWEPAQIAGKNVNSYYIIPVVFSLQ